MSGAWRKNRKGGENNIKKKEQGHDKIHKMILVISAAVLTAAGFQTLNAGMESRKRREEYEKTVVIETGGWIKDRTETKRTATAGYEKNAEQKASAESGNNQEIIPENLAEPETASISEDDFKKLARINPDIVGWIRIPDTNINYPIVQGYDNETYLHKDFEGKPSAAGSIFLDFESQSNLRGYNNILYGHHMKDGSMFRDLVFFKEESYFKEHQYFQIDTPKETIYLKAVACYFIRNNPLVRRTAFRNEESFQQFVQEMTEPCRYAELPDTPVKGLYTLITCSYEVEDGRTVLFAVEVR